MGDREAGTYMLIERFRDGDAEPVYARLRERGRMLPEGLAYVASWVDLERGCCFQLVETRDPALLEPWMDRWRDLVTFEVHRVVASEEAARRGPSADAPSRGPRRRP